MAPENQPANPEGNYVEQQCHDLPDRSTAPVYATLSLEGTYGEQPAVPGIQCYDLPTVTLCYTLQGFRIPTAS